MLTGKKLGRVIVVALGLAGCSSTLPVKTSFAPSTQFAKYRTYSWLPLADQGPVADVFRNSPAENRIRAEIGEQLGKKGMVPATGDAGPDFVIAYHVVMQDKLNPNEWGYGLDPTLQPSEDVYSYDKGTLIVDFIDPTTKQAFWRGHASDVVDNPGTSGKIEEGVEKVIEKYPPSSKDIASAQQAQTTGTM